MAEVLVAARNLTTSNTANDALRYRQGDIVAVFADGHVWGALEALPDFWRITVTSLLSSGSDRTTCLQDVRDGTGRLTKRRQRFLDITLLSNAAQTSLATTGSATVLRLAFLNALTLRP